VSTYEAACTFVIVTGTMLFVKSVWALIRTGNGDAAWIFRFAAVIGDSGLLVERRLPSTWRLFNRTSFSKMGGHYQANSRNVSPKSSAGGFCLCHTFLILSASTLKKQRAPRSDVVNHLTSYLIGIPIF